MKALDKDLYISDSDIKQSALSIGTPVTDNSIAQIQMQYWMLIKQTMITHGYIELKKSFPHITEEFANQIKNWDIEQISKLSFSSVSLLAHIPDEKSINDLLNNKVSRMEVLKKTLVQGRLSNERNSKKQD